MLRRLREKDFSSIEDILKQHLAEGDAQKRLKNLGEKDVFVYLNNGKVLGFISGKSKDRKKKLDEVAFNGYNIVPIEDYAVIKSCYVDKDFIGRGIGSKLGRRIIEYYNKKQNIDLFYTESWIKTKGKSSSDLLEKHTSAEKIRYSENHWSGWKKDSQLNMEDKCPGCLNKNKNCNCSGAIYRILYSNNIFDKNK